MTINMDILPVDDENEATILMAHHLGLAAMYFEATHDDRGLRANKFFQKKFPEHIVNAASAFVDVMCSTYEKMDE